MAQTSNANGLKNSGKGLALPGLIVGLLTGFAVYGIVEYWIDDADDKQLALTVLLFVVTSAAAYLLLAETGRLIKAAGAALVIAAALSLPDYTMANAWSDNSANLSSGPPAFWFFVSRGLAAYLLVTLVKASLEDGAPPPYAGVFFHGITMPLIAGGAKIFAGLALVLLFAWARLLKEMDVNFFNKLFQEPWFILPFLGAVGGVSIAMMRGQQAVLGALRFILLLFCRIAMPITALFTVTFLFVLAANGTDAIFDKAYPGAIMIGLAFAGMLIFNGVYQNGEGGPPPLWLRLSTQITLLGFPVYAGLAFYAFWLRIGEYGLTPLRITGISITGLAAAYSIVCLAGLLTEANWRGKKWMPFVAPLNTMMAGLWVFVLVLLATPLANPWAISARSQYARIANQKAPASEFDFGYLHFELGKHGDKALDRMLRLTSHPEADEIRKGVARAQAANSYWEYKHPELATPRDEEIDATAASDTSAVPLSDPGPMALEFNPEDAQTSGDDPSPADQPADAEPR